MARRRRQSAGGAAAPWGLFFVAIAAGVFLLGLSSWPFFLLAGVLSYLAASRRTHAPKRRRHEPLQPAYETAPAPKPPKPARRRRAKVPVTQFDERGRTPLERALHGDDSDG